MSSPWPPPMMYSDRVYDYPADPPPRSPWLTPMVIIGTCVAVIALVVAALALIVPMSSKSSTVTSTVAAPPSLVTQVSTVTMPPPSPRTSTVVVVPAPIPPPQPQPVSACQRLRIQANADDPYTAAQAKGYWVPQLSSSDPVSSPTASPGTATRS